MQVGGIRKLMIFAQMTDAGMGIDRELPGPFFHIVRHPFVMFHSFLTISSSALHCSHQFHPHGSGRKSVGNIRLEPTYRLIFSLPVPKAEKC